VAVGSALDIRSVPGAVAERSGRLPVLASVYRKFCALCRRRARRLAARDPKSQAHDDSRPSVQGILGGQPLRNPVFLRKNAVRRKSAAKSAAPGRKIRKNPDSHTGIVVANGQAVAGWEAATGRKRCTANLAKHQPRTRKQSLSANADITDTQNPEYQEAMSAGTGAGTSLVDVLRAIASLSDADRELLLELLKTLRGANT
jgi:hypothetical protein